MDVGEELRTTAVIQLKDSLDQSTSIGLGSVDKFQRYLSKMTT